MTHICVGKQTIIGSDNGLSPEGRQAIIWTNAGILLIGPYGTNFSEISIKILTFSFTKMRLNVSSAKWRPFCLGLNVLSIWCDIEAWWHMLVYWVSIDSVHGLAHVWCKAITWVRYDFQELSSAKFQCFKLRFSLSCPKMFRKFPSLYNLL